jgi:hypothetical protein
VRKLALLLSLALGVLLATAVGAAVSRAGPPAPVRTLNSGQHFLPPFPNPCERFGFDSLYNNPPTNFDVAALNAGWYSDWGAQLDPAHPDDLTFAQLIRFKAGSDPHDPAQVKVTPSKATIAQMVAAHPGALWMLGNEPDSLYQGDPIYPDVYAHVYHETYTYIKGLDPTALIANGGIVQPTPCRLMYLDIVWNTYQQAYGEPMPVDVWNIHAFTLREVYNSWGASTPPGVPTSCAMDYRIYEAEDMDIFRDNLVAFRQWMKDRGQQDRPLIISEYGILWPDWLADEHGVYYTPARVSHFMTQTFDLFLYESFPEVGQPEDDYRLVQAWAWYSLSDDQQYNGYLFHSGSKQISDMGEAYADYTAALNCTPGADLTIQPSVTLDTTPLQNIVLGDPYEATSVTLPIWVYVSNLGKLPTPDFPLVAYSPQPTTNTISLPGRYTADVSPILATSLVLTRPARYEYETGISIVADPAHTVDDPRRWNNGVTVTMATALDVRPDLAITATAWSLGAPDPLSGTVNLTLTVANEGMWPSPAVSGTLALSNAQGSLLLPHQRFSIPALTYGEQATLTEVLPLPNGIGALYTVTVEADSDDVLDELDEGNNRVEVLVDARPDLSISTTDWRLLPPDEIDGILTVTLTVKNEGVWPTPAVSGTLLVDNPRGTLSLLPQLLSIPPLDVAAQTVVTEEIILPASANEDIYLLSADVDSENTLDEQNEDNNNVKVTVPVVICTALEPGASSVLTSTSGHMVLVFPTGTVTISTEICYSSLLTPEVPPGPAKAAAFQLAAYRGGQPVSLTLGLPATVTWRYTDDDVARLDEEKLGLYHLTDSDAWERVFRSAEQHQPESNLMFTRLQQTGLYVFGQAFGQYMPLVLRGSEGGGLGVQTDTLTTFQEKQESEPSLDPGVPVRLPLNWPGPTHTLPSTPR